MRGARPPGVAPAREPRARREGSHRCKDARPVAPRVARVAGLLLALKGFAISLSLLAANQSTIYIAIK